MKKKMLKVLGLLVLVPLLGACANVKAGQVGVETGPSGKVKTCGIGPGTHYTGFGGMKAFTTRLQYSYFTANDKEGDHKGDDSVPVSSVEGASLNADIQVGYTLTDEKKVICDVFNHLARDDIEIRENIIRPAIRAQAPLVFTQYSAKDAKTVKRGEIAGRLQTALDQAMKGNPYNGFVHVQSVQIGDIRVPANIQGPIDQAITAEADKTTAEAQRAAQLTRAQTALDAAQISAQQKLVEADATAESNRRIAASLTPELAYLQGLTACADALSKTQAMVPTCGGNGSNQDQILIQPKNTK